MRPTACNVEKPAFTSCLSQQPPHHHVMLAHSREGTARVPVRALILAHQVTAPLMFHQHLDDLGIRDGSFFAVIVHLHELRMAAMHIGQQRYHLLDLRWFCCSPSTLSTGPARSASHACRRCFLRPTAGTAVLEY